MDLSRAIGRRSDSMGNSRLRVERLESRRLLHGDISLSGGVLVVAGTESDNVIEIDFGDSGQIAVSLDGDTPVPFPAQQISSMRIDARGGNDMVDIAESIRIPARVLGGTGDDTLVGGRASDQLRGGIGSDMLFGRGGDDLLAGQRGDDSLSGGNGGDVLRGRGGADVMHGGDGADQFAGGQGIDIFEAIGVDDVRADFLAATDVDVAQSVIVGSADDAGLLGTRTDAILGAPPIADRSHVTTPIDYSGFTNPPTYGPHSPAFVQPTGVYSTELETAQLVHNLEHGHVWISYNPTLLPSADRQRLEFIVGTFGSNRGVVLAPRAANGDAVIALASWGHLQTLTAYDATAVRQFILTNRGHAPEGFITP